MLWLGTSTRRRPSKHGDIFNAFFIIISNVIGVFSKILETRVIAAAGGPWWQKPCLRTDLLVVVIFKMLGYVSYYYLENLGKNDTVYTGTNYDPRVSLVQRLRGLVKRYHGHAPYHLVLWLLK